MEVLASLCNIAGLSWGRMHCGCVARIVHEVGMHMAVTLARAVRPSCVNAQREHTRTRQTAVHARPTSKGKVHSTWE